MYFILKTLKLLSGHLSFDFALNFVLKNKKFSLFPFFESNRTIFFLFGETHADQ